MRSVAVTGGAGYIGSHICKALQREHYLPVTLDNLSRGHASLVQWGPMETGDIRDMEWVRGVLRKYAPEAIIHCAGFISVSESVAEPALYYDNNVSGTVSLLNAVKDSGAKRFVFSSSCAVHGIPQHVPIHEDEPCAPITPYGASKWMAERVIADYAAAYGFSYVNLRYFNAAGADPDGETGELHEPETHAIPLAVMAAMQNAPFTLYGTDYPTPDGTAVRDYIHVADLAKAHILAMEYMEKGGQSRAINVGTGNGISVRALVEAVSRAAKKPLKVNEAPRRAGDPPSLVADISLSRALLGFTPAYSDIDTVVDTAWRWHAASARSRKHCVSA